MDNMHRGLDLPKAQAALKRAANKAMHGSREERSGRFQPKRQSALATSGTAQSARKGRRA
jgi:hypothetical protein